MESILTETPKLYIDGNEYKMPRLSINLAFKFIGLVNELGLGKVSGYLESFKLNKENGIDENTAMFAILTNVLSALGEKEDKLYEIIGILVGVEVKEAKELPIIAFVELFKGMKEHPDLKVFLQAVKIQTA